MVDFGGIHVDPDGIFGKFLSSASCSSSVDRCAASNIIPVVLPEVEQPDLKPINLTTTELSEAQTKLLKKGPSFCPTPKDVNWQSTLDDLDKFERRIRQAVYYHTKNTGESTEEEQDAEVQIYHCRV